MTLNPAKDPSCVLAFDFGEPADSIVYDLSGKNNNGTIYGAIRTRGYLRYALSFDGVNDYVEVPHSPDINPTQAITVIVWAKSNTENWNKSGMLVSKRNAYILHPWEGGRYIAFFIHDGIDWRSSGNYFVPDLTIWHLYTGTYDSVTGELRLYVDGILRREYTLFVTINPDTGSMFIGWDDGVPGRYLNGFIGSVRLYNEAKSESWIKKFYNYGISKLEEGMPLLSAEWLA